MFSLIIATFLASLSGGAALPQSAPAEPTILRESSVQKLDVPSFSSWDATPCDSHGNLYYRPVPPNNDYNASVLRELDPKSQFPTVFQLPTSLATTSALMYVSVAASGRVRFLNQLKNLKYAVFGFDDDAQFKSEADLELPDEMRPNRFLVAEDGVILVGGYYPKSAPKQLQGKTYLALFEKDGKLRKEITGANLTDLDLAAAAGKMIEAVTAVGPEGFYYLQGQEILVISEWGELVRHINVKRPRGTTGALRMDISEGLISIEFYEKDEKGFLKPTFLVLDASSGDVYGLYKPSDDLGTVVVCFTRAKGYVFSRTVDGKINLLTAALR